MKAKRPPNHRWALHSGDYRAYPPTAVEKCAYCGAFKRITIVTTSRVGVHSATFTNKEVPVYSANGVTWVYTRPTCAGKTKETP